MFASKRREWMTVVVVAALIAGLAAAAGPEKKGNAPNEQQKEIPTVQLALLLDTSNSMDGLIDQAKTQLWKIVGQFAKTKLGGQIPRLEVALYEYGNDNLPATDKGITVSTIFCGDRDEGVRTNWEDGAKLAEGSFLCINQDHQVVAIDAPQDQELARLSTELNATYLPYGDPEARKQFADRQEAQDVNAARSAVSAAAARAGFKASSLYRNSGWDLVDAVADGTVKLEDLKPEQLPEAMQPMSPAERKAHLAQTAQKRKDIQARIQKLTLARDDFLAKERARLAAEAPAAAAAAEEPFAEAVMEAVEAQVAPK